MKCKNCGHPLKNQHAHKCSAPKGNLFQPHGHIMCDYGACKCNKPEASRGEQACGMPLAVNPQEPHRRKGEITEVASRKSKANREPLASSPRIPESLKKEGNDDWIMLSVGERGTGMSDCGLKIKQKLEGKI